MLIRTSAAKAAIAVYAMLAATTVTAQSASIIGGRARCDIPDVAHTQAALTDTALYGGQVVNGGSALQAVQLLRFDALSGDLRVLRTILSSNTTAEATFAVAARNADVIYAVDNRAPSSTVHSVIRTVDRGASWTPLRTLACLPGLRAGPFGQSVIVECDGVAEISTDGGVTWRPLPQGGYAFSRTSDATLFRYASLPGGAVHRSDDGGVTFAPAAMRGFVPQVGGRFEPDANDSATLYFLTYGSTGFHYQFSRNGGDDWTTVAAWPGNERFAVAGTTGTLYTRSLTGPLLRSRDFGATWEPLSALPGVTTSCQQYPSPAIGATVSGATIMFPELALVALLDAGFEGDVVAVPLAPAWPILASILLAAVATFALRRR